MDKSWQGQGWKNDILWIDGQLSSSSYRYSIIYDSKHFCHFFCLIMIRESALSACLSRRNQIIESCIVVTNTFDSSLSDVRAVVRYQVDNTKFEIASRFYENRRQTRSSIALVQRIRFHEE